MQKQNRSLLDALSSSPYKMSYLAKRCLMSSPSRLSKIVHNHIAPSKDELITMRNIFCNELKILHESELLNSIKEGKRMREQEKEESIEALEKLLEQHRQAVAK